MSRFQWAFCILGIVCILLVGNLWMENGELFAETSYKKPPKEILDILNIPPTPGISVSPRRDRLLLLQGERYPPIADLAAPMLRLAGLRINPRNNGPHAPSRIIDITLMTLPEGKTIKVKLPANPNIGRLRWSPDGKYFAFTQTTPTAIELYIGNTSSGNVRKIRGVKINAVYGSPLQWMPDSKTLLCQIVPKKRGQPPEKVTVPRGPRILESKGKNSPVRTYQDLLHDEHDEDLFDYYATSQLALVDAVSGKLSTVGKPALLRSVDPSPDGKYLLVVRTRRPYSYLLPAYYFPKEVEIWTRDGKKFCTLASLPLADQVPIEGVPTGPRLHHWLPTEPATVVWTEALDEGDPRKKVPHRDRLLMQSAPFEAEAREWFKTQHRFNGVTWAEDDCVFVRDYDRDRRWRRTFFVNSKEGEKSARLVWDLSVHDRYGHPGLLVMRTLPNGFRIVHQHKGHIFLVGDGASPKGDMPFLDKMHLKTLKTTRFFQCADKTYERPIALLAEDGSRFLTRYESLTEPPNYIVRSRGKSKKQALTHFTDPAPHLRKIKKQLVTYKRSDGVQLSFTLYLPPDYKQGQRLPAVLWAYPREFVDARTAGQVTGSPYRFTTLSGTSHLFFLLQGYAVLNGATMPVIGDPETANNTYVQQTVGSARAAIDKANEMGFIDPERIGVGGHSYGAFMTANLLAHSDLFRAGIARSGAFNRTLTPFGFQNERRTLWEAPDIYFKISPFMNAHKINEPLLLIHGEMDNNSGTFPMQSERMYHAIKGNGGAVRLVVLPDESHGYHARESVEHTLYEMIEWFERYVKDAPARAKSKTDGK